MQLTLAVLPGLRFVLQLHLLQVDGTHQLGLHAVSHPGTQRGRIPTRSVVHVDF